MTIETDSLQRSLSFLIGRTERQELVVLVAQAGDAITLPFERRLVPKAASNVKEKIRRYWSGNFDALKANHLS